MTSIVFKSVYQRLPVGDLHTASVRVLNLAVEHALVGVVAPATVAIRLADDALDARKEHEGRLVAGATRANRVKLRRRVLSALASLEHALRSEALVGDEVTSGRLARVAVETVVEPIRFVKHADADAVRSQLSRTVVELSGPDYAHLLADSRPVAVAFKRLVTANDALGRALEAGEPISRRVVHDKVVLARKAFAELLHAVLCSTREDARLRARLVAPIEEVQEEHAAKLRTNRSRASQATSESASPATSTQTPVPSETSATASTGPTALPVPGVPDAPSDPDRAPSPGEVPWSPPDGQEPT